MFAIIQSGGRQVKVAPGETVSIDRVPLEAGESVSIDQVLLVASDDGTVVAGTPFVANARVVGVIAGEVRGPKIRVFKKKRRKAYKKTIGHRATLSRVEIKAIEV